MTPRGLGVPWGSCRRAGEEGPSGPSFKGDVHPLSGEKALPEGNHPQSDKTSLKGGSPRDTRSLKRTLGCCKEFAGCPNLSVGKSLKHLVRLSLQGADRPEPDTRGREERGGEGREGEEGDTDSSLSEAEQELK